MRLWYLSNRQIEKLRRACTDQQSYKIICSHRKREREREWFTLDVFSVSTLFPYYANVWSVIMTFPGHIHLFVDKR